MSVSGRVGAILMLVGVFLMTMVPAWGLEVLVSGIVISGVGVLLLQEQVRRYREAEGPRVLYCSPESIRIGIGSVGVILILLGAYGVVNGPEDNRGVVVGGAVMLGLGLLAFRAALKEQIQSMRDRHERGK